MAWMQEEAKGALKHAAEEMSKYYDRNQAEAPEYHPGDKVWLSAYNYATECPAKKFSDKWLGPFEILKVISQAALKLKLPKSYRIHPVVSVSSV